VRAGEGRLEWLDGLRLLDLALRGPRPASRLSGVSAFLSEGSGREGERRRLALPFWERAAALLAPLEAAFDLPEGGSLWRPTEAPGGLASLLAAVREAATLLGGDDVWRGPAGARRRSCWRRWRRRRPWAGPDAPRGAARGHGAHDGGRGGAAALWQHRALHWGLIEAVQRRLMNSWAESTRGMADRGRADPWWRRRSAQSSDCLRGMSADWGRDFGGFGFLPLLFSLLFYFIYLFQMILHLPSFFIFSLITILFSFLSLLIISLFFSFLYSSIPINIYSIHYSTLQLKLQCNHPILPIIVSLFFFFYIYILLIFFQISTNFSSNISLLYYNILLILHSHSTFSHFLHFLFFYFLYFFFNTFIYFFNS
jgi:hypothetical protein